MVSRVVFLLCLLWVCSVVDAQDSAWRTVSVSPKKYLTTVTKLQLTNSTTTPMSSTTPSTATKWATVSTSTAVSYYPSRRERPQQKVKVSSSSTRPGGTSSKPTKYHYYPHNQHIYLLPECALQQVCNAVYVRLNFTQPLCACPSRRDPCSASINPDDHHTVELVTDPRGKALTLVKTCEMVTELRECRSPRDWSLLALQNIRTGKSHYLVICRCPRDSVLDGPMSHDQPTYASVPGIRVYGMMCVQQSNKNHVTLRSSRPLRISRAIYRGTSSSQGPLPPFPWHKVQEFVSKLKWTL